MTVPRWTWVNAEYPSAAFEVGPEDLMLLRRALQDHLRYYDTREAVGGGPREESDRIKSMLHSIDDLRRELDMQVQRSATVKTVTAIP
jgi:hypothetical protein